MTDKFADRPHEGNAWRQTPIPADDRGVTRELVEQVNRDNAASNPDWPRPIPADDRPTEVRGAEVPAQSGAFPALDTSPSPIPADDPLREALRRSAEAFHGLMGGPHDFYTFAECHEPQCAEARAALQQPAHPEPLTYDDGLSDGTRATIDAIEATRSAAPQPAHPERDPACSDPMCSYRADIETGYYIINPQNPAALRSDSHEGLDEELRNLLEAYWQEHPRWLSEEDDGCPESLALRAALGEPGRPGEGG